MRCWEARRKLTELLSTGSGIVNDAALIEHLQHCPDCAAKAAAWRMLRNDLNAAAPPDLTETVPLDVLRQRVEGEAAGAGVRRPKERSVMAALFKGLRTRPRYGFGIAAIIAVVALSILIPLKYDHHAVGYEVALAGVDRSLAMDSLKMNDFLAQLGVKGAGVTVSDCDKTCKIRITKLKSQDDAKLVMAAFGDVAKFALNADAYEVISSDTGREIKLICTLDSLKADNAVFDDSVHQIVIQRCGTDFDGHDMIWVAVDSSGESTIKLGNGAFQFKPGEPMKLNDETITELEAQGIHVQQFDTAGHKAVFIMCDTIGAASCDSLQWLQQCDSTAAKSESGTLPEGYSLDQNYPNPFNPTTTIAFTLPSAQKVRLEVYNVQGQLVKTLVDGQMESGRHSVEWDATDQSGARVASGVYLYRLTTGQGVLTKKMSLVK